MRGGNEMDKLTPKEKWERINNPKTFEDYGLGLTEEELRTFPEGRAFLIEVRMVQRYRKNMIRLMHQFGKSVGIMLDELAVTILHNTNKDDLQ